MPGPIYEREGERAIAIVAPDTDRAPTLGSGWAVPYGSSSRWTMDSRPITVTVDRVPGVMLLHGKRSSACSPIAACACTGWRLF